MLPGHESDLELGSHPVGGRDQDRVLVLPGIEREEPAESPDVRDHFRAEGSSDQWPDQIHKLVPGVNIHPGAFISNPSFQDVPSGKKLME